jgi:hypothetical protein
VRARVRVISIPARLARARLNADKELLDMALVVALAVVLRDTARGVGSIMSRVLLSWARGRAAAVAATVPAAPDADADSTVEQSTPAEGAWNWSELLASECLLLLALHQYPCMRQTDRGLTFDYNSRPNLDSASRSSTSSPAQTRPTASSRYVSSQTRPPCRPRDHTRLTPRKVVKVPERIRR